MKQLSGNIIMNRNAERKSRQKSSSVGNVTPSYVSVKNHIEKNEKRSSLYFKLFLLLVFLQVQKLLSIEAEVHPNEGELSFLEAPDA